MTETQATTPDAGPVFPPGRYGRRREPQRRTRWLLVALAVLVGMATVAVAMRLYRLYGDPLYDAEVTRITEMTEDHTTVEFTVTVQPGGSAVCTIRARADSGDVGSARVEVRAEPGLRRVAVTHRLPTTGLPRAVDVPRCGPTDER